MSHPTSTSVDVGAPLTQTPPVNLFTVPKTSERGLTTSEARLRLALYGLNEPAPVNRLVGLDQFVLFVIDPLVLILLIASGISWFLGEQINAVIIAVMVVSSIALNILQTFRSQRAVEHLRAGVALTCTVLRDGDWQEVQRREVVLGDVIRLSSVGTGMAGIANRGPYSGRISITRSSTRHPSAARASRAATGIARSARADPSSGTSIRRNMELLPSRDAPGGWCRAIRITGNRLAPDTLSPH